MQQIRHWTRSRHRLVAVRPRRRDLCGCFSYPKILTRHAGVAKPCSSIRFSDAPQKIRTIQGRPRQVTHRLRSRRGQRHGTKDETIAGPTDVRTVVKDGYTKKIENAIIGCVWTSNIVCNYSTSGKGGRRVYYISPKFRREIIIYKPPSILPS